MILTDGQQLHARGLRLEPADERGDVGQAGATDTLVDLLIATAHRINARADTKVTGDFVAELKRVSGKENILFKMTEAALGSPESRGEDVIYPAVPGGYRTLVQLLHEYKAKGTSYRQHKQRVFKASYTNHYRTGLIQILEVLEFGSTNTVHAPMVQALTLIKRYKAEQSNRVKCYALGESVPVEGIVPAELVELMYRADSTKRQRILRTVYECGVFQTLREKLRCKEIWVVGADRWRAPTTTCRRTSRTGGPRTTPNSANRWIRRRSSTSSGTRWTPNCRR
ncbi:hypothetical protein ACIBI2_44945 [Streptosporangium canum]|uniref:hypothetical protein n=1 Tax=Streptosporangium canum TaxID=324952 RepID=UPI0037A0B705